MKNQLNPNTYNAFNNSVVALVDEVEKVIIEEAVREAKLNVVECLTIPEMVEDKITEINLKSLKNQTKLPGTIVREAMQLYSTFGGVAEWFGVETVEVELNNAGQRDSISFEWVPTLSFEEVVKSVNDTTIDNTDGEFGKEVFDLFRKSTAKLKVVVENALHVRSKERFSSMVEALYQVLLLVKLLCLHILISEINEYGTATTCVSLTTIMNEIKENQ